MSSSFRLLRLFGTDLRLHWSLPLGMLLFVWLWQPETTFGLMFALVAAALLFASVTLHELGHSLVARVFGIATQSIVLWPLGGFAILEKRPAGTWQDILVTAAGPLVNLGVAALVWLALTIWSVLPPAFSAGYHSAFGYVQLVGDTLVWMNVSLALFNLLPTYPLDGGQIARRLLVAAVGDIWATRILLPLSVLFVLGLLGLGLQQGNLLVASSAVFIGFGTLTLSRRVTQRMSQIFGSWQDRGYAYLQAGDADRAIQHYNRVIPRESESSYYFNNRGYAYALKGQFQQAVADYSRALEVDKQMALALANRANAYRSIGEYALALRDCDTLVALEPEDAGAYYRRAVTYYRQHDYDRALVDIERAIELAPQKPEYYRTRGTIYTARSTTPTDLELAIAEYTHMLTLQPDNADAYNDRAYARFLLGDHEAAWSDVRAGFQHDSRHSYLYSTRGELYQAESANDLAQADFHQSLKLTPGHTFVRVLLARAAYDAGDMPEAREQLAVALAENAAEVLVLSPRELAFYVAGALEWQLFVCECAEAQRLSPALTYLSRGDAYRVNGQHELAIQAYEGALRDNRTWDAAQLGRGQSLLSRGDAEQAISDLKAVIDQSENAFFQRIAEEMLF